MSPLLTPDSGGHSDPVRRVLTELQSVGNGLPADDGVAAFNLMYLITTRSVADAVQGQTFADPAFLGRLDEVFADLYLSALDSATKTPESAPEHWRALFELRRQAGISPLQFAVAGMNAHINADLALALVRTAQDLEVDLHRAAEVRHDFLAVNEVLERTQPLVKQQVLTGLAAAGDRLLGQLDDTMEMWAIGRAREFAWASAQSLWLVRGSFVFDAMAAATSRMVGLTSRLLLRPAG